TPHRAVSRDLPHPHRWPPGPPRERWPDTGRSWWHACGRRRPVRPEAASSFLLHRQLDHLTGVDRAEHRLRQMYRPGAVHTGYVCSAATGDSAGEVEDLGGVGAAGHTRRRKVAAVARLAHLHPSAVLACRVVTENAGVAGDVERGAERQVRMSPHAVALADRPGRVRDGDGRARRPRTAVLEIGRAWCRARVSV